MASSISMFIRNELSEKKKMISLIYFEEPASPTTLDHHKSPSMNDKFQQKEDDEYEDFFFTYEEEQQYYEDQRTQFYAYELQLLGPLFAPPHLIQPNSVPDNTNFITKDGYINHSLVAERAILELSTLARDNNGIFRTNGGILNQHPTFHGPIPPNTVSSWTHASRASTVVNAGPTQVVKMLTTLYKWRELFPSIVSKFTALRFLSQGSSSRNPDGSLQLVYATLQTLTPFVPERTFTFLRACKQIDPLTWVVADISIDRARNIGYPCGCLIQGIADGVSQVTWVEHLEFEENYIDHKLYTDLSLRGFGFGAQRWVACLERSIERRTYRTKTDLIEHPWQYEKKCVMTLSKKMVRNFCLNIEPADDFEGDPVPPLSFVPILSNMRILVTLAPSPYHDDRKEKVLISSTTFSLPQSPEVVLEILGDENRRHEWDVSCKISQCKKPTCYTTGSDSRNKISIYQTYSWIGDEVILQEASVTRSSSLLVWCVLKSKGSDDLVKIGKGGVLRLPLIGLSGLAISSNCHTDNTAGGSIVTLCVQQEAHDISELDPNTLDLAKKHIMRVALRIDDFLNMAPAPDGSPKFHPRATMGTIRGATA